MTAENNYVPGSVLGVGDIMVKVTHGPCLPEVRKQAVNRRHIIRNHAKRCEVNRQRAEAGMKG